MTILKRGFVALMFALIAVPAVSQTVVPTRVTREIDLSGPRFGFTLRGEGNVQRLKDRKIEIQRPLISQFGWQFERRLYSNNDGITALTEWVPLISGLGQGLAPPAAHWLAGVRTTQGMEFGIGPNISPAGVGLVIAAGVT